MLLLVLVPLLFDPSSFRFLLSLGCGFRSDPRTVSVLLYDLNVTVYTGADVDPVTEVIRAG